MNNYEKALEEMTIEKMASYRIGEDTSDFYTDENEIHFIGDFEGYERYFDDAIEKELEWLKREVEDE